jgi:hypothetical protein
MILENFSIELGLLEVLTNLSQLPVFLIKILNLGRSVKYFLDILRDLLISILSKIYYLRMRTKCPKFRWLEQLNINTQQKFYLLPLSLRYPSTLQMTVFYLIEVYNTVVKNLAVMNFTLLLIIEALD